MPPPALLPIVGALICAPQVAGQAMRVPPLPPAWTAASETSAPGSPLGSDEHEEDDVPSADLAPGPRVSAEADRAGLACLRELRRLGIPFRREKPTRGIQTPVVITGPVRGVKYTAKWGNRPTLMDCRFALTLYRVAPAIRASGVNELLYSSFYSYRNVARTRSLSRHALGLAVDVFEVRGPGGLAAEVEKDWIKVRGTATDCVGPVRCPKARALRRLACALDKHPHVHLILSPDSDYAHRDHFHISGLREGEKKLIRRRQGGRAAPTPRGSRRRSPARAGRAGRPTTGRSTPRSKVDASGRSRSRP